MEEYEDERSIQKHMQQMQDEMRKRHPESLITTSCVRK